MESHGHFAQTLPFNLKLKPIIEWWIFALTLIITEITKELFQLKTTDWTHPTFPSLQKATEAVPPQEGMILF